MTRIYNVHVFCILMFKRNTFTLVIVQKKNVSLLTKEYSSMILSSCHHLVSVLSCPVIKYQNYPLKPLDQYIKCICFK